ncbi:MAG: phospho-sugar mutase [Bacteroidota bacterium]|nr:phospho-sugar mutase [Bacteroidota bacterium]
MEQALDKNLMERVQVWLDGNYDNDTKAQILDLMKNKPAELSDAFYRDLEFGTGGLRGIMGPGTNRMNKYTVGMATQGLANYLKKVFPDAKPVKLAVSHDSRNNSRYFAEIVSEVLTANGFRVYLFDDIRPTPELSFAIRQLQCHSGIMITASHNPKEYNGYKAYWSDGAQMIAPHDVKVMEEVGKIHSINNVKWNGNPAEIVRIGEDIDKIYLNKILGLSLSPDSVKRHRDLKIVYTPLHGCGRILVPRILSLYGFENVSVVKEQAVADGNFPTVHSPNPEEPGAMNMALELARKIHADLVMATDPDADRVGIAIPDKSGNYIRLNGNQTAAILFYYVLTRWQEKKMLKGNEFIVKTIVTTDLLNEIAGKFDVTCFDCLTGFKYIADVIRSNEGKLKYIIGGEESFGYLAGDFVRDKDSLSACSLIAEAAAWTADRNQTLFDLLLQIYKEFGFYKEQLFSVTKKGKKGADEIRKMMIDYRKNPMKEICGCKVIQIKDLQSLKNMDVITGNVQEIDLPASNVLQFFLEDGTKISMRPSGTEPKIKFYFSVRHKGNGKEDYDQIMQILDQKIHQLIEAMHLT